MRGICAGNNDDIYLVGHIDLRYLKCWIKKLES
jgi:hypothetical protein